MIVPPVPVGLRGLIANGLWHVSAGCLHLALWICPEKTGDGQ